MELIDLINHVKANVEAGKKPEAGLLFMDCPAVAVNLNVPDKYSLEKSPGEKLCDEAVSVFSNLYNWNECPIPVRDCWQWLAEREQTLKAQADAWEAVFEKLNDVIGPMFGLYTGTGVEVALKAIDDLVAGQKRQAMTGEQFYNEVWKPHFVGILMGDWDRDLAENTKSAMETAARMISPRKLTGQDIIDAAFATNYGIGCMVDYWNRVAEKLNAK